MLVNEAKRILAADSRALVSRVDSGKIGPEKIGPVVLIRLSKHIMATSPDRATRILIERAIRGGKGGDTHSEQFAVRLSNLLVTTLPRMDPETRRGILFYVTGDTRQFGIAVVALQLLGESSGIEMTNRLLTWKEGVVEVLKKDDLAVRAGIATCPPQIRRLANGSLHEAAQALSVGDERTARSWLMQIRKLVERFGEQ